MVAVVLVAIDAPQEAEAGNRVGRDVQLSETTVDVQPRFPIRAAFYYPWFPNAWDQGVPYPYTKYNPSLGLYASNNGAVVRRHIASMRYGGIEAGISSWWGRGDYTDRRLNILLRVARQTPFRWSVYYEEESLGDPSPVKIRRDLNYLKRQYGSHPAYLRVNGRFVVFVYADGGDGCDMARRWRQANVPGAYIVLKVFPGYEDCPRQPHGWHQYSPAVPADSQGHHSYSISPGFNQAGREERLPRQFARWRRNVRAMVQSDARFQLVTTFNEWGEGTSVESARQWRSPTGHGRYMDILRSIQ